MVLFSTQLTGQKNWVDWTRSSWKNCGGKQRFKTYMFSTDFSCPCEQLMSLMESKSLLTASRGTKKIYPGKTSGVKFLDPLTHQKHLKIAFGEPSTVSGRSLDLKINQILEITVFTPALRHTKVLLSI